VELASGAATAILAAAHVFEAIGDRTRVVRLDDRPPVGDGDCALACLVLGLQLTRVQRSIAEEAREGCARQNACSGGPRCDTYLTLGAVSW
jgi:hypothetical protein